MNILQRIAFFLLVLVPLLSAEAFAGDSGLFRIISTDIPPRGVLRVSNVTFHSKTRINDVLRNQYGVENPRLLSSITSLELGLTRNLALTGSIPYFADLFDQAGKGGHKAGAGDIAAGLRLSFDLQGGTIDRFSLGTRVLIPEQLGYDREPLGFRTFSLGEFAYSLESAARMRNPWADLYFSAATYQFPKESERYEGTSNPAADVFYDTGFGFRGIGEGDETGYAPTVSRNQFVFAMGAIIPFSRSIAGLLEYQTVMFPGKAKIPRIDRLTPGIRLGKQEGINLSLGMDFGFSGPVSRTGVAMRLSIPSISPRDIGEGLGLKKKVNPEARIRSKNTLVAVREFSARDKSFLYERELRDAFQTELGSMELMNVLPVERVDRAFGQESLVPVKDSPQKMGVRLGAQYLINTQIQSYCAIRGSRFTIPFLVMLPKTDFVLSARISVSNLADGTVHDLGIVTATVVKCRGTVFFPMGGSSDLVYIPEPETRRLEKELIDRWVDALNARILERIELFDWTPKHTGAPGESDPKG